MGKYRVDWPSIPLIKRMKPVCRTLSHVVQLLTLGLQNIYAVSYSANARCTHTYTEASYCYGGTVLQFL